VRPIIARLTEREAKALWVRLAWLARELPQIMAEW
jgi:hypothetical protein